jgi:hypothetical protein
MKKLFVSVLCCFALVQIILAQAASPKPTDSEADELLGAIKNLHLAQTSLAYQSVVVQHMLPEANYFSAQLKLPTPHPIRILDVNNIHVTPPWYSKIENTNLSSPVERVLNAKFVIGGFTETTNFCFYFRGGNLWSVVNRVQHMERFDLYPVWAKTPSLINSNGAYQLATQWLASVDIDVNALGKNYKPKIEQAFFWNQPGLNVQHPPGDTNKTLLPIFNVTWGTNWANYPGQVRILGTTKELMELRVGDSTLSRRPLLIITNAIELNNIPDPPMKHLQPPSAFQTNSAHTTNLSSVSSL